MGPTPPGSPRRVGSALHRGPARHQCDPIIPTSVDVATAMALLPAPLRASGAAMAKLGKVARVRFPEGFSVRCDL